jgi:tRNA(fMet)-specific endonuclease VapC
VAVRLALDTNRYTDLCRGEEEVVFLVEHAEAVFLPFAVVAELRAGFALGRHGIENERVLRRLLMKPGVAVLFRQLRRQGTPIPTNDLWIAALVLQHDLVLCARDRHFDHLPQITKV